VGTDSPNYNTGALTATTNYRVWVNADENGCEDVYSSTVTVTVFPDITITAQPVGGSICTGGNFDLSVTASGSPNIHYQWQSFNGTAWSNVGSDLATYNTGLLTATTSYRVFVNASENGCEDLYSTQVTVTVTPDIVISAQPVGGSICTDGDFNLTVTASGSPDIHYQWEQQTGPTTWITVGTDSPNYNTGALTVTTNYRVWVNADENGCEDVYSSTVTVTVFPDISISAQPVGGSICTGGDFNLSVSATGSPDIHYQWEQQTGPTTWITVGTDSPNYNTGALTTTTNYRVWVNADENGCEDVYSSTVTVTVFPDISISAQPVGGSICTGGNLLLNVVASGSPDIHYQWEQQTGPTTWITVGTDSPNYNTGALTATTNYRVWVNADENGCEDVYSSTVTVTVFPDISISAQPVGGSICTGGNLLLNVVASGSPDIHYQWEQQTGPTTWITVGTDSPNYNTGALTATTNYRVWVNADENGCEDVYSSTVTVTVFPDILISTQPVGGSICTGGDLTLNVVASGSPDIHYQWQAFTGTAWVVVGSDLPTYNTGAITSTTNYRVFVFSNANGCEDLYSNQVTVIVTPDITISGQPVGGAVCVGGTWNLNVVASGAPLIHYQWQDSTATGSWQNVSEAGGTTSSFTTDPLSVSTWYRVFLSATENGCEDIYSATVLVSVFPDIVISVQPTGGTICSGGNFDINVVASGSPNIHYQWEIFNGSVWNTIPSATSDHYNTGVLTQTTQYRVFVFANENGCEDIYSQVVTVTVVNDLAITTQPGNIEECIGGTNPLNVVTTGGTGTISYQWQSSSTIFPSGFSDIIGATASSYTPPSTTEGTTFYRVIVSASGIGCDPVISLLGTVVITPDAVISVAPESSEICVGGSADLTATLTGGSSSASFQWQYSPDGLNGWTNVGTPNENVYTVSPATVGLHYYRVVVTDTLSGCSDPISNVIFVQVRPDASISVSPELTQVCVDGAAPLTAIVTGGSSLLTIQWETSNNIGGPWVDIDGENGLSYNAPTNLPGTIYYRVRINDGTSGCFEPYSSIMTVIVNPDLVVSVQPVSFVECIGGDEEMSVQVAGGYGAITYQWQSSQTGTSASFTDISGATSSTFTPSSAAVGTTWYRVLINANGVGCDNIMSDTASATINPDIAISLQPVGFTGCVDAVGILSVQGQYGTGALSYQWQLSNSDSPFNWSDISGAQSTTYTPNTSTAGMTWYRVIISSMVNGCQDAISNIALVDIVNDPSVVITAAQLDICDGGVANFTSTGKWWYRYYDLSMATTIR
jgi:hypothetical protein